MKPSVGQYLRYWRSEARHRPRDWAYRSRIALAAFALRRLTDAPYWLTVKEQADGQWRGWRIDRDGWWVQFLRDDRDDLMRAMIDARRPA